MRIPEKRIFEKKEVQKSLSQKEVVEKYLRLLDKFNQDSKLVTRAEKKWILENCNCDTENVSRVIINSLKMFEGAE